MAPRARRHSVEDLPQPGVPTRWVRRRKTAVVAAILDGRLTIAEACQGYDLSTEELTGWRKMVEADRRSQGVTA